MKKVTVAESYDKFKPERCVFVISVDKEGNPSGMACGMCTKCSRNPGLFAVVLSKKGYTQELIRESKEFVIAVPNKSLEKEVRFFGSISGRNVDKFKESKIETERAEFVKSPLIKNATLNFECKLYKEVEVGDHVMFIGEILASYINEDKKMLLNMEKVNDKRIFEEF